MEHQTDTAPRDIRPALLLLVLSPLMAELITSSTPPLEFFQPLPLILLPVFYGFAAVLLRDFALRQRLGRREDGESAVRRHFGRLIETTLAGRAFVDIAMTVRDHRDHAGDARV